MSNIDKEYFCIKAYYSENIKECNNIIKGVLFFIRKYGGP